MPLYPTTKVCPKCKVEKPREAFAKQSRSRDGLQYYCKECHRPMVRAASLLYHERPDIQERAAEDHRKRWNDPNDPYRQRRVERHRERRTDPAVREQERQNRRTRYQQNKDQAITYNRSVSNTAERKARSAVMRAVAAGKLPRAQTLPCSVPGCTKRASQYHHTSYDEEHWLDVQAVCSEHHGQLHWTELGEKPA